MAQTHGRITEKDLYIPALRLAANRPNGFISTSDLIAELEKMFEPEGEDAAILEGRHDTKFSQIVRNLKSHKTSSTNFINRGYAEDVNDGIKITDLGRRYLAQLRE
jgi:hypothetical protein